MSTTKVENQNFLFHTLNFVRNHFKEFNRLQLAKLVDLFRFLKSNKASEEFNELLDKLEERLDAKREEKKRSSMVQGQSNIDDKPNFDEIIDSDVEDEDLDDDDFSYIKN